ncbi:hypothetical protein IP86_05620 [Rhodopseudomonas sp. AAP120]|uniref:hypothetical protein n=1 Tax=Rhodopseudomonas sp. AAP120 TaxID=1523430 RepID=UPI0006B8E0B2|nr:hypothetical protein [Rhodopseudomonas sp. AAP120]KPG01086.1 hypothetical protein IP86_05620 [Rhodopseudomonas sp. AAP120]
METLVRPLLSRIRPGLGRLGLLAAAGAVIALTASDAEAARRRAANFDGTWNVVFATRGGNCSPTYNAPFAVQGRRVASAGGGKVTGGITGGGNVAVRISVGASVATGRGRLAGNTGSGTWSGLIQGDRCHGVWQATRS